MREVAPMLYRDGNTLMVAILLRAGENTPHDIFEAESSSAVVRCEKSRPIFRKTFRAPEVRRARERRPADGQFYIPSPIAPAISGFDFGPRKTQAMPDRVIIDCRNLNEETPEGAVDL